MVYYFMYVMSGSKDGRKDLTVIVSEFRTARGARKLEWWFVVK